MRVAAIAALAAVLGLAGCGEPEPVAAPMSHDEARCAAAGFQQGSAEMAACIRTAAEARTADRERAAARIEQARREQARVDAEWQASLDGFDAEATGTDGDAIAADPLPSADDLPEMQCIGVGDEAVCVPLTAE